MQHLRLEQSQRFWHPDFRQQRLCERTAGSLSHAAGQRHKRRGDTEQAPNADGHDPGNGAGSAAASTRIRAASSAQSDATAGSIDGMLPASLQGRCAAYAEGQTSSWPEQHEPSGAAPQVVQAAQRLAAALPQQRVSVDGSASDTQAVQLPDLQQLRDILHKPRSCGTRHPADAQQAAQQTELDSAWQLLPPSTVADLMDNSGTFSVVYEYEDIAGPQDEACAAQHDAQPCAAEQKDNHADLTGDARLPVGTSSPGGVGVDVPCSTHTEAEVGRFDSVEVRFQMVSTTWHPALNMHMHKSCLVSY